MKRLIPEVFVDKPIYTKLSDIAKDQHITVPQLTELVLEMYVDGIKEREGKVKLYDKKGDVIN